MIFSHYSASALGGLTAVGIPEMGRLASVGAARGESGVRGMTLNEGQNLTGIQIGTEKREIRHECTMSRK
jgi:hypothetical protein